LTLDPDLGYVSTGLGISIWFGREGSSAATMATPPHTGRQAATRGPLTVHPRNPRYFADSTGRAILLAGSHTWASLQEAGPQDPPEPFDWKGWLEFMVSHDHNFMRLWTWENAKGGSWYDGDYYFTPIAWKRTGPGPANDGKPKFDLTQYDEEWFTRLRDRAVESRDNGIYIAVMLFQGWSGGDKNYEPLGPNPWHGHPFNAHNNVNGVDGSSPDGEGREWVHTLRNPDVVRLQEAYVRQVIDTVNDLDNVMFEIGNEHDGSPAHTAWQYHMINYVHEYELTKPVQHPVLLTSPWPNPDNKMLFASAAEAVSPMHWNGRDTDHWPDDPPAGYLGKVVVADTDHIWGVGGTYDWVWRTFTRGHNLLYMDPYGYLHMDPVNPDGDAGARQALGRAASLSRVIDLAEMVPRPELASTGYALARERHDYLIYDPYGAPGGTAGEKQVLVDLTGAEGTFRVDWHHPVEDRVISGQDVAGGGVVRLREPDQGRWVARVWR
jgi:hypothetical protein